MGRTLAVLLALVAPWIASAQDDGLPIPDRVEEDWEVVIAQPDRVAQGPQLTTCMAPSRFEPGLFVAFNRNFRRQPVFRPGGLQVQAW